MEKASPRRRTMKTNLICIPKLRANCSFKNTINRVSPMSLLERFREAVFRLMMFSALSKATHNAGSSFSSPSPDDHHGVVKVRSYNYHPAGDPHHSEAVADCIEFIKKTTLSGSDDDSGRDSTASSSSSSSTTRTSNSSVDHSSPELVFPVPVM